MDMSGETECACYDQGVAHHQPSLLSTEPIREIEIAKGIFPEERRDQKNAQAAIEIRLQSLTQYIAIVSLSQKSKTVMLIIVVIDPSGKKVGLRSIHTQFSGQFSAC